MTRTCRLCHWTYDDAEQSTICPHVQFLSPEERAQKDLAFSLLGKDLTWQHEAVDPHASTREVLQVESIAWDGMITLRGWSGQFAPHLFRILESA